MGTVNAATSMLVIGQDGWLLRNDGRLDPELISLSGSGFPVKIGEEDAFLQRLDCGDERGRRQRCYTLDQISRLMNISRGRVR